MTATLDRPRQQDPVAAGERRTPAGRFRGRWRVALRYGARDARRNKGRTALVAVMVALPVALGSFVSTVLWSSRDTPEHVADTQVGSALQAVAQFGGGVPAQQTPDLRSFGATTADVPLADLDAGLRAAMPPGAPVTQGLLAWVKVAGDDLLTYSSVLQVDVDAPGIAGTFPLAQGSLPGSGQVALTSDVADDLGVAVGDDVALRLNTAVPDGMSADLGTARVSGLLADTVSSVGVVVPQDGPLVAPELVQANTAGISPYWLVGGDAPVTWPDVLDANRAGVVVSSRAVILDPPPASDVPGFGSGTSATASELLESWGVFGAVVVVALLEAVLLIGPAFAVSARRSARSLALVVANGGGKRVVRAVVLGTGVVIGAVAAVVGATVGVAAAAIVIGTGTGGVGWFQIPWLLVAAIAVVGVLLTVAGAWIPARGAAKADVVAVLAGRRGDVTTRRWPAVVGTVVAAVGYAAAIVGGVTSQILALLVGVVLGQVGLVLACGGIVALLGRVARHLSLSWRLALRDAARHRNRTSPAIAAVLVATAGATAGLAYSAAQSDHDYRSQAAVAAPGILLLVDQRTSGDGTGLTADDVEAIRDIVRDIAPEAGALRPVTTIAPRDEDGSTTSVMLDRPAGSASFTYHGTALPGMLVDDGSLLDLLGIPEADRARQALEAGRAVVQRGTAYDDGTMHFRVETWKGAGDTNELAASREDRLPATEVGDVRGPSTANLPVVPPSLADRIGLPVRVTGIVSTHGVSLSAAEQNTLSARLGERFGTTDWGDSQIGVAVGENPHDYGAPDWLATLLILGAGVVLALAAAWIAAALAATESRPDLATLTAVGSAPSTRKRVVAAQAGTITVTGTVVGTLSGLALGAALVLNERYRYDDVDVTWAFAVPWLPLAALLVGLPLVAVGAAWLVTRSRLTLTRRLTG